MNFLSRKIDAWRFSRRLNRNLQARKQARKEGRIYVTSYTREAKNAQT